MATVSRVARSEPQPSGGYLPAKWFTKSTVVFKTVDEDKEDTIRLTDAEFSKETIHPTTIGMIVDLLTRVLLFGKEQDVYEIARMGELYAESRGILREDFLTLDDFIVKVKGTDKESVDAVCQIVLFESIYRSGMEPNWNQEIDDLTYQHIKLMVERSVSFLKSSGVTGCGQKFPCAYNKKICAGDMDFLSADTLFDMKVSKKDQLDSKQTLQLGMYYTMGKISSKFRPEYCKEFGTMHKVAIYNPRSNLVFELDMDEVDDSTKIAIEEVVCGGYDYEKIKETEQKKSELFEKFIKKPDKKKPKKKKNKEE